MRPWLFFDVKFDIRDVRSSTSETREGNFQAEMIPLDDDLIWTPDMVTERPGDFLERNAEPIVAPEDLNVDGMGDRLQDKFLEYLLRYHRIVIYRNTFYDLYASPAEPFEDFLTRCRDCASQDLAQDFRALSDRYLRRLLQIEDSLERASEEFRTSLEKPTEETLETNRIFLELREEISTLCLEGESSQRKIHPLSFEMIPETGGTREKLQALRKELHFDLLRLRQDHSQRAESIEPFPLTLTLNQIDIVGTAILWQS
ncbi:MAG: hypothetical protein HY315_01445 [Acidobacteria bacterium]|nr:hypothetical protein [Acidobacteriota bacterium]